MNRRRVVLVAVLLVLLTYAVASTLIHRSEPEAVRVYQQIELGMGEHEVAGILAPCFRQFPFELLQLPMPVSLATTLDRTGERGMRPGWRSVEWVSHDGTYGIYATVDGDGKLTRKHLVQMSSTPTLFDRLQNRLSW